MPIVPRRVPRRQLHDWDSKHNSRRRNSLPSVTLRITDSSIVCNSSGEVVSSLETSSCASLIAYLLSEDTRLPAHELLRVRPAQPCEYDTYVGEDVWKKRQSEGDDGEDTSDVLKAWAGDDGSLLQFVMNWISEGFALSRRYHGSNDSSEEAGGVVLCGQTVCASDAAWAVPSQSVTLQSHRDVLLAMRMSPKFVTDLQEQYDANGRTLEVALEPSITFSLSSEFRIFARGVTDTHDKFDFAVCQRSVDMCFPELANKLQEELKEVFCQIVDRFVATVGEIIHDDFARFPPREPGSSRRLVMCDILFESSSLPSYALSATCLDITDGDDCAEEDNLRYFRLLRSFAAVQRQFVAVGRNSLDINICDDNVRLVTVAETHDDLCGDGALLGENRLPIEFVHPEQLDMSEEEAQELKERYEIFLRSK